MALVVMVTVLCDSDPAYVRSCEDSGKEQAVVKETSLPMCSLGTRKKTMGPRPPHRVAAASAYGKHAHEGSAAS